MIQENKVLIIPIVFAFLVTVILGGYGFVSGNQLSLKMYLLLFGMLGIFCVIISLAIQALMDIVIDFFDSNTKGQIIILLIILIYVLRMLYQMKLAE